MTTNKFVKAPVKNVRLSKEAGHVLFNLSAQTHPDPKFRAWVEDEKRNIDAAVEELLDLKLIQNINGVYSPTIAGVNYFKVKPTNDVTVEDLVRRLNNVIPKNPSFTHIADNLTDTGVIASMHALLFQMGKRSNPEDPESIKYWQSKIDDLKKVLAKATPDTLYDRGIKAQEKI